MDNLYYIETDFECAFLINGVFREHGGILSYPLESPLYITVFPLSALLLPYTAKIVGGVAIGNENLVECFSYQGDKHIVKLKARHNYVYSPAQAVHKVLEKGTAYDLFGFVKRGDLGNARKLLTRSLSSSIDDDNLIAFFSSYTDIMVNSFVQGKGGNYLLVRADKKCDEYLFTFAGSYIDNIEQVSDIP